MQIIIKYNNNISMDVLISEQIVKLFNKLKLNPADS